MAGGLSPGVDALDGGIEEALIGPTFGANFDRGPGSTATTGEPAADAMEAAFPRVMALDANVSLMLRMGLSFGGELGIEVAGGGAGGAFGVQADCQDESALGERALG